MKEIKKTLVTLDLETSLYFRMLEICVSERWTIDEFVEKALQSFIDKHKIKKPKRR